MYCKVKCIVIAATSSHINYMLIVIGLHPTKISYQTKLNGLIHLLVYHTLHVGSDNSWKGHIKLRIYTNDAELPDISCWAKVDFTKKHNGG